MRICDCCGRCELHCVCDDSCIPAFIDIFQEESTKCIDKSHLIEKLGEFK